MDLRQFYNQRNGYEEVGRRNCAWLISQFEPGENFIRCKIGWSDCPQTRGKLIGETIIAMLYSSGYWSSFTTRQNGTYCSLNFRVERMTEAEHQRERERWGQEDESDSDDDAPNKIDGLTAPVAQHSDEKTTT